MSNHPAPTWKSVYAKILDIEKSLEVWVMERPETDDSLRDRTPNRVTKALEDLKEVEVVQRAILEEERPYKELIDLFLHYLQESDDGDISWIDDEARPFLHDRILYAKEVLESILSCGKLIPEPTQTLEEVYRVMLIDTWENQGRKSLASRMKDQHEMDLEYEEDENDDDEEEETRW